MKRSEPVKRHEPFDDVPRLVPVRMLNEYAYCPRLAYLEWVQGEFAHSVDTVKGAFDHRIVDKPPEASRPVDDDGEALSVIDSAYMSAPILGLVGIIDRVEIRGKQATPIDYKHGKRPGPGLQIWIPDKIQLCAYALILEENGFHVSSGVLYYVSSRERIEIPIDEALKKKTRNIVLDIRLMAAKGVIPPPLDDSPKCPRCSLAGICLPDETDFLHHDEGEPVPEPKPRMILPSADESLPVYVQTQGLYIGKSKDVLKIKEKRTVIKSIPIHEISSLSLFGGIQISTQAIQTLCKRNVPVCFFTHGGWFYGVAHGLGHKNIELRIHQYHAADDERVGLTIAGRLIADKIINCRTLLRRNARNINKNILRKLTTLARKAASAQSRETLLGFEGNAAKLYFAYFEKMIKKRDKTGIPAFHFDGRNKRPPRDPVNALLSFAYSMLTKTWMVTLYSVGLDPYLGFYHGIRYGRPALALDMMEPFRPLIADSTVITVLNNRAVKSDDFIIRQHAAALKSKARSVFIGAFEKRLSHEITHPVFGYRITYRQVLEVQARLLGRYLSGEIDEPPMFKSR